MEMFPQNEKPDMSERMDHLTPKGKHKSHRVNKLLQSLRFWEWEQDHANDVLGGSIPPIINNASDKKDEDPWWNS